MRLLFAAALLAHVALGAEFFNCPSNQNTGLFADPDQCDKYWECNRGEATARYCADGLAFSSRKIGRRGTVSNNPCDYSWIADCDDILGPANGTAPCDRQNGHYPKADDCTSFWVCTDDVPHAVPCAAGLVYKHETRGCDWPGTDTAGCQSKTSIRGFVCPEGSFFNSVGLREQHPRFNDPRDCRDFFVCLEGVRPQENRCPLGEVFSESRLSCTLADYVPECNDYYRDHPLRDQFVDLDGDGRVDKLKSAFF